MLKNNVSKKKISLFIPSLKGGGAERAMLNLANELSIDNNFKVDLVLIERAGTYLAEVKSRVNIVDLKSSNVPKSLFPLIKYLKKEKPDILISTLSHASVVSILATMLSKSKAKTIVRMANTFSKVLKNINFPVRMILFFGVKIFFRFADEIVAVSDGVADDLAKTIKISRDSIKVIYNSTDVEKIRKKCEESADHSWLKNKTTPVVLAVGRLTIEKDYPALIKAFSILSEKNNFRLIILGEGKKRNELENLIKKLELQEKIDLLGFTRNPFVYMRNCDVFVLSSATEGFPNTLIEAMACGTPVVSTDCPSGPREILDNGKFGKLVKVGDEKALAEAILETIKNPLSSEELINRVREKFSLEEAIKKYLDIIQKYLDI
jgi:glycosyltransferase involved in cell wall biosynthesis